MAPLTLLVTIQGYVSSESRRLGLLGIRGVGMSFIEPKTGMFLKLIVQLLSDSTRRRQRKTLG